MILLIPVIVILVYAIMTEKSQAAVPQENQNWLNDLIIRFSNSIDPSIVYGVVMTESSGNPNAKNPADPSSGLMGVTPLIGRAYGGLHGTDTEILEALLDPETNVRSGTGFIRHLQNRYQNQYTVQVWIQAYNVGETKFDKGIRMPSYGTSVIAKSLKWNG